MIDRAAHERISSLFLELRGLPADERPAALARIADVVVRDEVASLLAHDVEDNESGHEEARGGLGSTPSMIGPYRVLRRLGRGGSGYVLLGEQAEPVRRRVAIKVVPRAMIDPALAARFEFERRALERTEHPNIPRILDAGFTADGLPYLVMDFVDGVPITEFCSARRVRLEQRLALMLDVAEAVQHAHQRGVIHRDLKPANILVSDDNGRWSPRVVDFGIAKPADDSVGMNASLTSGLPLGTPAYMAPEQTGGGAIDTRADVYALGAVLYELVCERTPIQAGPDVVDLLQRIRTQIPAPASRARLASGAFEDDSVPRAFLADLDRVISRALEKEPDRRYATVAALADDVRRVLRREPVEARPQTRSYRWARFAERNRVLVAGLGVAAMAVVLGVVGLTIGLVAAEGQREEAVRQSAAQAEINRFLTDDLLASASPEESSSDVTVVQLLDRASRGVDERFARQPLVAAAVHHTLGSAYIHLGKFDQADEHLSKAVETRRKFAGSDAADTVRSEIAAAALLGQKQDLAGAERVLSELVPRARRVLGPDDPYLFTALNDLGSVYDSLGRGREAIPLLTEALVGRRKMFGGYNTQVIVTMSNLAQVYDSQGDSERSLGVLKEALELVDESAQAPRMLRLGLCNNIGATLQDQGKHAEAAPYLRRAAELAAKEFGDRNPATLTIQANLAALEARLGDPARAVVIYEQVVAGDTELLGPDAHDTLTARYGLYNSQALAGRSSEAIEGFTALLADVTRVLGEKHWLTGQTHFALARALSDDGKRAEALDHARRAVEIFESLGGEDHARLEAAKGLLASLEKGDGASQK